MSETKVLCIRESIAIAKQHEASRHALKEYLQGKLPSLHKTIALPDENAADTLMAFITQYIEHVPDFIEAFTELSKSSGIYDFAKIFIDIMEAFFIQPPELVSNEHSGLHALIDEAYLAHRLIEEINDRVMMVSGTPLAPMDMSISNIIVHDILGEEFANELDLAVHYSIESLFVRHDLENNQAFKHYLDLHQKEIENTDLNKWPCFANASAVGLNLSGIPASKFFH